MTDTPPELPVDDWPLPPDLRSLLDRFLSEAINLKAGEYLMQQGRMTEAQAMRDMMRRIDGLEQLSADVRRQFNALGELRVQQKRAGRRQRRASQKARHGW